MQFPGPRWLAGAVLLPLAALGPSPASAHAVIIAAAPAPDALLKSGDVTVLLRFNSRIDHARSRLTLTRPDASKSILSLDPSAGPDTLESRVSGLASGRYRLRWQVLGLDGHITRGDVAFEVSR
jgi:methionine-rich copper-binding protein CopC